MEGSASGLLGGARARHRRFLSAGSALLVAAFFVICLVEHATAASSGVAGVNRTVPKVTPPSVLSFSSPPADDEFLRTGLFAEPLVPVAATTSEENRDLAQAVFAYRDAVHEAGASDSVEPLLAFLAAHPASPWSPSLQLNLGMIYRQTGHFSKALEVWQTGWNDAQALSDPHGRALANAMVARLSQLEAYLGRKELLQPLLDSIRDRPVGGTAAQLITDSHTGLHDMVYYPEKWFRCGPLALHRILTYGNATPSPLALQVVNEAHSTANGLSLSMVREIAVHAGMDYQTAYRTPGAAVIIPAVAHWKVGHFAAIVDQGNGRYIVQDTTFGEDIRVSPATLDEEASGYFLVPAGPLPAGWRPVSVAEGSMVWGRGGTGNDHDPGATGAGCIDCAVSYLTSSTGISAPAGSSGVSASTGNGSGGYTTSAVELEVVGLQLHDAPVGYTPPLGPPVRFELYYSHRDTQQLATFNYTNFGPKWTFTWLSYITDCISSVCNVGGFNYGAGVAVLYLRGGGNEPFTFASTSSTTAYPGPYSQATMTRSVNSSGNSTGFTLTFPDGSFEQFDQAMGTQFFMTAVSDPAGNIVTLTYDNQMRIVAITDAIGQVSTLSYDLPGNPLLVTQITDPFGRSATFTYNSSGQLASITDVLGITSSYTYGQTTPLKTDTDFINTLTTPYGSTTFTYGDTSTYNPPNPLNFTRFVTTVDPLGRTSYVEFDQDTDAGDSSGGNLINPNLMPTGMNLCNEYLDARDTFIFDANEYAMATQNGSLNYSLGKVIHWLHSSDVTNASRFKESEKEPLENRVWYNYPGQGTGGDSCILSPVSSTGVANTPVVINGQTQYANIEPAAIGRVLDNGASQVESFSYNSNGNLLTATDAVGRTWKYTYAANNIDRLTTSNTTNGGAQLLETRTYNSQHLPLTITGPNGIPARYQYNTDGQVTRYTDPLGHATTMSYDSDGHLKSITGPISTAKYSFTYDNVSRIASVTDPAAATVRFTYDAADRPLTATYPDGTSSTLEYTLLDLTTSIDRLHQTTRYGYDADRELTSTTDPLSHTVQQGYNLAGQLNSITDANNHTTTLILDDQSRVTAKQYADGTSVSILYENSQSLPTTVTDALSQTTTYTYNIDNTTATVSYTANQPTASVSFTYDPIYPRLLSMTDGVGTTTYSYYPVSSTPELGANQLQSVTSPIASASGSDTVVYSYDALNRVVEYSINGTAQSIGFDALGRLISSSNPLDTFTYSYSDGTSRVTEVSSTHGPTAAMTYFGPTGDELLQQMNVTTHSGITALAQFGYTYNADNNVTSLAVSSPSAQTTSYAYDKANRLLSGLFSGSTPQYAYGYDAASNLLSIKPNGAQQNYSYTSTNTITAGSYDANGSPTSLASNIYTWDGANRILSFRNNASSSSSSFTYDGFSRLVRVVDSKNGSVIADHSYTWCGSIRCLAHDNTQNNSPVSTQYFGQGVIISGTPYYYVQDQLGSVTELVTKLGSVASQYTYDPYGNRTTVSSTVTPDIGYAGYFYHALSGLDFTLYRAYDPTHARWLNRDPIGEIGGVNLYAYVSANPLTHSDYLGLVGPQESSIQNMIEAAIATRNTATLETLIEGGGLTPAEQALAESALNQIQILNNSIASVSRLAQLLNRTVKQVKQAIEKCKQANLPKSGPVRNPDVVVNPATGEVYPLTPNGGVGDSIGDINEFLPPK